MVNSNFGGVESANQLFGGCEPINQAVGGGEEGSHPPSPQVM